MAVAAGVLAVVFRSSRMGIVCSQAFHSTTCDGLRRCRAEHHSRVGREKRYENIRVNAIFIK
jgi:hypothetical protein